MYVLMITGNNLAPRALRGSPTAQPEDRPIISCIAPYSSARESNPAGKGRINRACEGMNPKPRLPPAVNPRMGLSGQE